MTPYEITAEDIAACDNRRLLKLWHDRYHATLDQLTSEVAAAKITARYNPLRFNGVERKIAACMCAMKRIESRALELGFEPILTRHGQERQMILKLMAEIDQIKGVQAA